MRTVEDMYDVSTSRGRRDIGVPEEFPGTVGLLSVCPVCGSVRCAKRNCQERLIV